jgi:hypothetical protein
MPLLKHCELWDRPATRVPPENDQPAGGQSILDLEYVDEVEPRQSRDGLPNRQQWSEAEWQFLVAL